MRDTMNDNPTPADDPDTPRARTFGEIVDEDCETLEDVIDVIWGDG